MQEGSKVATVTDVYTHILCVYKNVAVEVGYCRIKFSLIIEALICVHIFVLV